MNGNLAEIFCAFMEDANTKVIKTSCGQSYPSTYPAPWVVPVEYLPSGMNCTTVCANPCW